MHIPHVSQGDDPLLDKIPQVLYSGTLRERGIAASLWWLASTVGMHALVVPFPLCGCIGRWCRREREGRGNR